MLRLSFRIGSASEVESPGSCPSPCGMALRLLVVARRCAAMTGFATAKLYPLALKLAAVPRVAWLIAAGTLAANF